MPTISESSDSQAGAEPPPRGTELRLRIFCSSRESSCYIKMPCRSPSLESHPAIRFSSHANMTDMIAVVVSEIFQRVLATRGETVKVLKKGGRRVNEDEMEGRQGPWTSLETINKFLFLEVTFKLTDLVAIGESSFIFPCLPVPCFISLYVFNPLFFAGSLSCIASATRWPDVNFVTIEMMCGLVLTFPQLAASWGEAVLEFDVLEHRSLDLSGDGCAKVPPRTFPLGSDQEQGPPKGLSTILTESQQLSR